MIDIEVYEYLNLESNEDKQFTVKQISDKFHISWQTALGILLKLDEKGLVEVYTRYFNNKTYRMYKVIKEDLHKIKGIQETPIRLRSNKDHNYLLKFRYSNSIKDYIKAISPKIVKEYTETKEDINWGKIFE
jgi:predicted ArsR family transcriptional regulator